MPPALQGGSSSTLRGSLTLSLQSGWRRNFSSTVPLALVVRTVESRQHNATRHRSLGLSPKWPPRKLTLSKTGPAEATATQLLASQIPGYLDDLVQRTSNGGVSIASNYFTQQKTLQTQLRAATIERADISKRADPKLRDFPGDLLEDASISDLRRWTSLLSKRRPRHILPLLGQASYALKLRGADGDIQSHLNTHPAPSIDTLPLFILQELTAKPNADPAVINAIFDYLKKLSTAEASCMNSDASQLLVPPSTTLGVVRIPERFITVLELFANLVWHARHNWPSLRKSIAIVFTRLLERVASDATVVSPKDKDAIQAALGFCCNAFLRVLAWPSLKDRFYNVAHQESAQAVIVDFMAAHNSPLELNKHGFRAIAMTQLMHPKTEKERRWAELKALSWPPWKEDKTGMDASIDLEYGISRATKTLNQKRAAGYADGAWDKVARLYGGWDTDLSPTIQYRFFLQPFAAWEEEIHTWNARIRTTRTLREAWAGFLAYEDSVGKAHTLVCSTMIEKILREQVRQQAASINKDLAGQTDPAPAEDAYPFFPGDTPELSPPPPSAHLETYTRTEPPDLQGFLDFMSSNELVLTDQCLAHLLWLAPNRRSGELLMSSRPDLLKGQDLRRLSLSTLGKQLSPPLREAWTKFRTRYPSQDNSQTTDTTTKVGEWTLVQGQYASGLNTWRRATNGLSRGLSDPSIEESFTASLSKENGFPTGLVDLDPDHTTLSSKPHIERLVAFTIAHEILSRRRRHHIPPTPALFQHFTLTALHAGLAAQSLLHTLSPAPSEKVVLSARAALQRISSACHALLVSTVATKSPDVPALRLVPTPQALLVMARALAAADAFDGLLRLSRYLLRHRREIERRAQERRPGQAGLGEVVAAIRAGVELGHGSVGCDGTRAAPERIRDEVGRVMDRLGWEGL